MKKMFKRTTVLFVIALFIFLLYKLLKFWFLSFSAKETDLFCDLKKEGSGFENLLLYTGIFLIFVSVVGIICLLFNLVSKKRIKKNKKSAHYKDLYSN